MKPKYVESQTRRSSIAHCAQSPVFPCEPHAALQTSEQFRLYHFRTSAFLNRFDILRTSPSKLPGQSWPRQALRLGWNTLPEIPYNCSRKPSESVGEPTLRSSQVNLVHSGSAFCFLWLVCLSSLSRRDPVNTSPVAVIRPQAGTRSRQAVLHNVPYYAAICHDVIPSIYLRYPHNNKTLPADVWSSKHAPTHDDCYLVGIVSRPPLTLRTLLYRAGAAINSRTETSEALIIVLGNPEMETACPGRIVSLYIRGVHHSANRPPAEGQKSRYSQPLRFRPQRDPA